MRMENYQSPHWTDDSDLLDRFVMKRVSESERTDLEQHLRGCERCQRMVQKERELAAGVRLLGREKMKELLRASFKKEEANVFQRYQFVSLAAAVMVILVGLGVFRYYYGSIEWPVKFAHRTYVVKRGTQDSSSASEENEKLYPSQSDEATAREPGHDQASQAESQAPGDLPHGSGRSTGTFWLVGRVVIIPESNGEERVAARSEDEGQGGNGGQKLSSGGSRRFSIQRNGLSQIITMRQQSSEFLPKSKNKEGLDNRAIETLVERTPQGLHLTLFRDTLFEDSQIQHASIEPVTEDSLIVNVANERIAYRIPGGWSAQQSTKPTFERR